MVATDSSSWSPDDTLRVLIASDIHLGYLENDPVRGEDSFIAFEEVLSLAVQYDVDMVLLGGDLFHHAKPTPSCMYKCTEILRKYCFGDKPVNIELLSDQMNNFSRNVNYEDPNLNVSYPVLSIHGNHDDPVGQESISTLDILSMGGLVNYFGKWTDYTHVRISPVLLQKGDTKLALYGLSHLKDQRLSRLFQEKKVEMLRDEQEDWFNLLVLHQNRAEDRGTGNFIKEDDLPKFLDLVVWGHEHDCEMIDIKGNKENDYFYVVQPGSTVATSLAAGESKPKHCGLLQIHKNDFVLTPLALKTVRPFIFKTIVLSEENLGDGHLNESEKVQEFLKQKVNEALLEAQNLLSGNPKQPTVPLIRLSVFYEREDQNFNRIRFGQNFSGQVANSNDVLIMKRERKIRERRDAGVKQELDVGDVDATDAVDVETLLRTYYDSLPSDRRLAALPVRYMTDAVRDFTLKQNEEILKSALDKYRMRCIAALIESDTDTEIEAISARLVALRDEIDASDETQLAALRSAPIATQAMELSSDDEVLKSEVEVNVKGRGRGARGGRGGRPRGARGRGRGRNEPEVVVPVTPPTPERRTPRRTAAQKTTAWLQNVVGTRRRRDSSDIEEISD